MKLSIKLDKDKQPISMELDLSSLFYVSTEDKIIYYDGKPVFSFGLLIENSQLSPNERGFEFKNCILLWDGGTVRNVIRKGDGCCRVIGIGKGDKFGGFQIINNTDNVIDELFVYRSPKTV